MITVWNVAEDQVIAYANQDDPIADVLSAIWTHCGNEWEIHPPVRCGDWEVWHVGRAC